MTTYVGTINPQTKKVEIRNTNPINRNYFTIPETTAVDVNISGNVATIKLKDGKVVLYNCETKTRIHY